MGVVAWHEDVDKALIGELLNAVKVPKKGGGVKSLPKNHVIVRKPEEDYKIEVYPSVSIYNITDNPAQNRKPYSRYAYLDLHRTAYAKADYRKPLEPFTLVYQLDFWAKFKRDMNEMVRSWLSTGHTFQFNLPIEGEEGVYGSCNVMQSGNVVHSDLLQEKERLFHDIISYMIWVEIEDETVYTTNIAERVDISVHGDLQTKQ